jgi:soluble lytic murein transglycosylase-like protein
VNKHPVIGRTFLTILLVAATLSVDPVHAKVPPAYRQVAAEYGIPPTLFYALALTESGARLSSGKFRPWPWTLNTDGKGRYFPTRESAFAAIQAHRARGKRSIDIGLMQVNWRYHNQQLRDPWQALDPYFNLRTSAEILTTHYEQTADWWVAMGRYHSPGVKPADRRRAARYAARVKRHWHMLEKHDG